MTGLLRTSYLIFQKDFKSEFRTRYVINSLLMFVIVIISIIRFAVGDEKIDPEVLAGLLWIAIFFSSSNGLSRVFIKEEEKETSASLKLSSDSTSIFLGKLFFNVSLNLLLTLIIIILFIAITDYDIKNFFAFILIMIIGNLGLATSLTIIAAIISKANSKGTLYPVLSFPILLPLLVTLINSTKLASSGIGISVLSGDMQILISYTVVVTAVSFLLFRFIWED